MALTSASIVPKGLDKFAITACALTFAGGVLASAFIPVLAAILTVLSIVFGLIALPNSVDSLRRSGRAFKIFLASGGLLTLLMAGNILARRSSDKGYEMLLHFALLVPLILALNRYLSGVKIPAWRALFTLSAVQMMIMIPASFIQVYYLEVGRAHGAINANVFAHLLGAHSGLISVWLFLTTLKRPSLGANLRLLAWQILAISTLFLTGTRGVIIAFAPLIVGFIVIDIWQRRKVAWQPLLFSVVALSYLMALVFVSDRFALSAAELNLALAEGQNVGSIGRRLGIWAESWRLIKENPLLGHGYFAFSDIISPELTSLQLHPHAHNQILNYWLMLGMAGPVFILWFMGQAMVVGLKQFLDKMAPEAGLALVWLSGGFFVFGLTDIFMAHTNAAVYLTVVFGVFYLQAGLQVRR